MCRLMVEGLLLGSQSVFRVDKGRIQKGWWHLISQAGFWDVIVKEYSTVTRSVTDNVHP